MRNRRSRLVRIAATVLVVVGALYGSLYVLNAVFPALMAWVVPQSLYPTMFHLRLVGKV